jgi:hypothetical protein
MEVTISSLRHCQDTPAERSIPGPPYGEGGSNHFLRYVCVRGIVPELDGPVKGTSGQSASPNTIPIDSINLGIVGLNRSNRISTHTVIPDPEESVMRTGDDVGILPIPLNLGGTGKPIRERYGGARRRTQIPTVYKTIDRAGRKEIWMESGEVDVGDGARMGVQYMFN